MMADRGTIATVTPVTEVVTNIQLASLDFGPVQMLYPISDGTDSGGPTVPTTGQLWPRGNWS